MEKTEFLHDLEELHSELGRTHSIDPESRQLLEQLQNDIQAVLKQSTAENHASLVGRLTMAVNHLEESHPALTKTIKNILDNLASI